MIRKRFAVAVTLCIIATPLVYGHASGRTAHVVSTTCEPSSLSLTTVGSDGAMGHIAIEFRFHNRSTHSCTLYGFPGAQLFDSRHHPLHTHVIRGADNLTSGRPRRLVRLIPGGQAYFILEAAHIPTGNESCPTAHYLVVTPPGDYRSLVVTGTFSHITACGGRLTVSPVEPSTFQY